MSRREVEVSLDETELEIIQVMLEAGLRVATGQPRNERIADALRELIHKVEFLHQALLDADTVDTTP